MPSKLVTRFHSMARPTIAGVHETAAEVAQSLAQFYDAYLLEGEARPDWVLIQNLFNRRLVDKTRNLAELDTRLEVGRTSEKEARAERNQLAAELRQDLTTARLLLDQNFGRTSGHFRWRDLSHVRPSELIAVARETAISLRSSPKLAVKAEPSRNQYLDAASLADALEDGARRLEDQIEKLVAPKRKRETYGIGEKSQEFAEAHSVRLRIQDLLFGIYRAAGKDHLATRLRPKRRMAAMVRPENGGETGNGSEGGAAAAGMNVDAQV